MKKIATGRTVRFQHKLLSANAVVDQHIGFEETDDGIWAVHFNIDPKLALGQLVRATRQRTKLSQHRLAGRLHSSQSRVAKLEAGDASVSLNLIVTAPFAAGAKKADVARAIAKKKRVAAG